ncbi:MAG: hypothetical protein N0C88_19705 [Candidatus Thiodiazotropha lotti]|uniref:Uncharacterized protein n=1 Tax=Candidatus Thiodiazotropha lotti TaxID=2792787 RepID=A0A9E4K915_9GAMM|nr:hypothetical protein [Candidatus Thiodiazotropha lotti]MCG7930748.1 hypothetical protein [Candidatus Thiodiazotropha lotti]MCG7941055.1 hypothetical protein [Candidatus Thiodiazotropha lotti]MCG7987188.1 hypothetical protein [Candidatus Thiodiazotropha lotti]MCG8005604.1 hypothetical protein [Candidatus Thiodiazotropha lotti]
MTYADRDNTSIAGYSSVDKDQSSFINNSWLDVHGAGAQCSDQKGGDSRAYTYVTDG